MIAPQHTKRRLKIVFVVTEDWYFCSHRLELAVEAQKAGYDVIAVTRMTKHQELIQRSGISPVNFRTIRRSSFNPLRELATFLELLLILKREKPDLVHLVALKPIIYGALAAKILKVPFQVHAFGGLGFIFSSNRILAKFLKLITCKSLKLTFKRSNCRLILQNNDDFGIMTERIGIKKNNVCLIRSAGVNLDAFKVSELPPTTPIVMLASRMIWDKGISEFVQAAEKIKEKGIESRFVLIGEPDEENPSSVPIEKLRQWNRAGHIEWWGGRNDMPKEISKSSIFCLPSYYGEGVPKVLIEAMSCARPIVTTDMPGCRDLVVNEENGIIVRPKDWINLSEAIEKLITDQKLCKKMGLAGRRIAEENYSLKKITSETLKVYEDLIGT